MWTRTYQKTFKNLRKEDIWRIWTDVNNWPTWHDDLDYCKFEGKFETGNYFILKPKEVNPVKIFLTEVKMEQSFTDCTKFFGAKMYDTHALTETSDGLMLSNTMTVTGPLKWLWIMLVAKNVADTVPDEMEALVRLARESHE